MLFQGGSISGAIQPALAAQHGRSSASAAQVAPNEAAIASEAAIATNMAHRNIVATYSYDIVRVSADVAELAIYKLYLIQVTSEPSVGSCQLARKTGKAFQKGAACPHAEVG